MMGTRSMPAQWLGGSEIWKFEKCMFDAVRAIKHSADPLPTRRTHAEKGIRVCARAQVLPTWLATPFFSTPSPGSDETN